VVVFPERSFTFTSRKYGMVKLIVFDLDGVLVNAKEIHYRALNGALAEIGHQYVIGRDEHLSLYDGLPTKTKLAMLSEKKGLPEAEHARVWRLKQEMTADVIRSTLTRDERLCDVLQELHKEFLIYVASNSIRESVRLMLFKTGLIEHIDHYLSNEDVKNAKPHSEIYLRCMVFAGVNPQECVIVEDSNYGRMSAINSGGHLLPVDSPDDVTVEAIRRRVDAATPK
jgi:HAD superfamily hydrolase (TIGR01509 family)